MTEYRTLRALSYFHSALFAALLAVWLLPGLDGPTLVLGWSHGLAWIAMSLLAVAAARRGTLPYSMAVLISVVGASGPFAGSLAFVVADRRSRRPGMAANAPQRTR